MVKNNPEKRKEQRIKKYGITIAEYNSMLIAQNNSCAICGHSEMKDKNFFPLIDHCHDTNKVRGLLCMNCNQGLGKFKDDIAILSNAIRYLKCAKK